MTSVPLRPMPTGQPVGLLGIALQEEQEEERSLRSLHGSEEAFCFSGAF